jgi:hypothetical protein
LINRDYLTSFACYRPETGEFFTYHDFKDKEGKYHIVEKPAKFNMVREIKFDDMWFNAGKVAFLHETGKWPALNAVIHKNGDLTDYRWENLTLDSPFKHGDVKLDEACNKWAAFTVIHNVRNHLGLYFTETEARSALNEALLRIRFG